MQLVDITSENWEDVIFLTTNKVRLERRGRIL